MTRLLLLHGRAQQDRDPAALKAEWIAALRTGLDVGGLDLHMADDAIRFPYFGDTLRDLVAGSQASADVVVRGAAASEAEEDFLASVLDEVRMCAGITDAQLDAANRAVTRERGPLQQRWVRSVLRALDEHVPFASASSIALFTRDVFRYLNNIGIRDRIEAGVRAALEPDVPTVVVGHSLGSLIGYNLLRRDGEREGWQIPLFVTLGSPLAVGAIKRMISPLRHPTCVYRWFNALDPRDLVALHPLDSDHFRIEPRVVNKVDVDNRTYNRHGIGGYLGDPDVATTIRAAVAG